MTEVAAGESDANVSNGAVLELAGLHVRFPPPDRNSAPVKAVTDVSLSVAEGQVLSLIGESGSGKSATLLAIASLLPAGTALEGELRLSGHAGNLLAPGSERRGIAGRQIAMVFQNPGASLNPVLSVGSQLDEVAVTHRRLAPAEAKEVTEDLLDRVGLPRSGPQAKNWARAYPHQLSGGQKQRIAIAAALAGEPRVLLADEPTTALDATVQAQILDLLLDLVDERGIAMIFVTHDLALAASIGDSIAVMRAGRIIESGSSRDIARHPKHAYSGELMRAALSFTSSATVTASQHVARREAPMDGLVLRSIHRSFPARGGGRVQALSGVSVAIGPGEIVGLIGESGSGKTTLGRIAAGLETSDSGEMLLNGAPFDPRRQRATVQMVFQDPLASFNPRRTIASALVHPLRRHLGLRGSSVRARIHELLEEVGLHPSLGARHPSQLSGGQLQRAAIARALAARPRFLVCDEAVASLDVSVRAQVLRLLERLRVVEGLGILMISHDLGVVKSFADHTIVLFNGREVEAGPTHRVLKSPREAYTRTLIAAVPSGLLPWRDRRHAAALH